jgi:autotransporter-associated beta strand protein
MEKADHFTSTRAPHLADSFFESAVQKPGSLRSGKRRGQTASLIVAALALLTGPASAAPNLVITLNSGATNLNAPTSYNPILVPNAGTDILFSATNTYALTTLTANGNLTAGTINDANGVPLTITNNAGAGRTLSISSAAGSNDTAVTGAGSVNDVIFVKSGSSLTFENGASPLTVAFTTGGNVDNAGTLVISSAVSVTNGQTVNFTGAGTTTVSGSLAATSGAITVANGDGTLILSGANLYTGGTTITDGALAVGSAGALGTGAVTNGGTLETTATPIAGATTTTPLTIHVNGDYLQTNGGTLLLQVASSPAPTPSPNSGAAGTNYDMLTVGGTATLGGTLDLNFTGTSVPSQGQRYVAVTAGAPLTSEFTLPTVTNLGPAFFTVTTYNDNFNGTQPTNSAIVTVMRLFGSFGGLTPNQASVARNIDSNLTSLNNVGAMAMPAGATADFFNNIVTGLNLSTYSGDLGKSLDELSPQRYEVLRNVAFDNYAFDVQSLDDELARERYGRGGIDTSGFAFTDSALGSQLSQIKGRLLAWSPTPEAHGLLSDSSQAVLGGVRMMDAKEIKEQTPTAQLNRWNGFIDGGVDLGDLDHNSDTSHASYTTGRVRGGIDYLVCDDFRVGALFGYAHTSANLDEEGSNADIDSYTPGIYAAYADKQGFYANGLFTYTRNDYSTQRDIIIPGVDRAATASPSGDQYGGDLDGGYEFHRGNWTFVPSAGLTYVNLGIDSFSESGAGVAGLNVNNQSAESLRSRLGGSVRYEAKIGSMVLTPHLSAYWQHEFLDGQDLITSQFEGLPAGGFSVQTIRGDTDNALLGFGLDAQITNSVTLFVDYQTEAGGANYFGQSASGGVKVGF